ncbi:DNA-binding transcriptional regulator, Lrp family [Jiangella alba]|uniref:DNA-binding transcriptional regulator, Lrp family n=1 Tax=Jiangella alba TaxID=561176 RepID=A0A1H5PNL9_9ACTN|nr:DNA-binding transcriptional regulator, Lrp family [Jiangella alba]
MSGMSNDSPAWLPGRLPSWSSGSGRLDDLDRAIIACLQLNGRATWQQIAAVAGASESTVSRRANRLLANRVVCVSAVPDPARCGLGTPVLMQVECAVGATTAVAGVLAMRSDVRFLALLTGSHDLVLEVVVGSRAHLADVLVDQLRSIPGITHTSTETVVRNFKTSYDWSRGLLGDRAALLERPPAPGGGRVTLDATDLQMVQILAADGRTSMSEVAARVGIGEAAARRRLDVLTSSGALWFATFVDPQAMGFQTEMFLWLGVDFARLEEVAAELARHPEVRYLSATAGYSDLACELVLRDLDDLYRFNTEVLGSLPGIRRVEMGQELQIAKRGFLTSSTVLPDIAPYVPR